MAFLCIRSCKLQIPKYWHENMKHLGHVLIMLGFVATSMLLPTNYNEISGNPTPIWSARRWDAALLYLIRFLALLTSLPYGVFVFLGLLLFNPFRRQAQNRRACQNKKLIWFRAVTRGNNPSLVRDTVKHNLALLQSIGLQNYKYELLANTSVSGLQEANEFRQTIVPENYRSSTGALFKARSLQFALEECLDLSDNDWIVHLDEETLLTSNSIQGIANFVESGRHTFGQGLITYSNHIHGVRNWVTTLMEMSRVADDMGKIRVQFELFNSPIFSMKGSFMVVQVGAEKQISFDNGPEGSIAEDCWLCMKAYDAGLSFGWIEGEMEEFAAFSLRDFILQRKRWFHGIFLVIYSGKMNFRNMFWLWVDFHHKFFEPIELIFLAMDRWGYGFIALPTWMHLVYNANTGLQLYMYVFGIFMSAHCSKNSMSPWRILGMSLLSITIVRPLHVTLNIISSALALKALSESKMEFYLVKKEK